MKSEISIVVPGYNVAWCMPQLVPNLREVIIDGTEVIFVDDGSTDGSADLFQSLFPEGICLSQENRGVGAARNYGVSRASGDFIQILDADDTIMPGKLKAQLEFMIETGMDVVYSDWRMRIVGGRKVTDEPIVHPLKQDDIVASLLGGWWFPNASALIRKSAYVSCGGCDPDLKNTCEDFHLWVQLAICGARFDYLPGYYANYHRFEDRVSMSNVNRLDFLVGEATIIENASKAMISRGKSSILRDAAAARRLHAAARKAYDLDHKWYIDMIHRIRSLDSSFKPIGPLPYRMVWNLCGHDFAEWLAGKLRKLK